jgi:hypothetical protein
LPNGTLKVSYNSTATFYDLNGKVSKDNVKLIGEDMIFHKDDQDW